MSASSSPTAKLLKAAVRSFYRRAHQPLTLFALPNFGLGLFRLDGAARERVRDATFEFIRISDITSVEANVVYAIAKKS